MRAALTLFSLQGITATTTKQIAERARVNEVTLFRQFGSKQGLLLAVLQEAPFLEEMRAALTEIAGANQPLLAYGASGLELLGNVPELVRSLIGEAGQLPTETRQALGQALYQANQQTVGYLRGAKMSWPGLSVEAAASLLNTLIVGHAVMTFSSDQQGLWQSQADFLAAVDILLATGRTAVDSRAVDSSSEVAPVADLPAETVRSLFQKAKKQDAQTYALVYVLFGAGLRVEEVAGLWRSHSLSGKTQHLLTLVGDKPRQVPLNRWIMGQRYGTYLRNPLTQWLKTRQDDQPEVFIGKDGQPLSAAEITALWAEIAVDSTILTGAPVDPFQARQTWCIELLMKGISLESLSLLAGSSLEALAVYDHRAKEKAALEQALAIDQKNN
ncbi:TetR family transcriptional regulator [Leptolyngbya sp. BC1307]|uniref:TetR family transcriptional regulator n=1 Tax=Leptolyngbya sp. BC1307 TaxID=2029589 RepID=UPI0019804646|nr:TetR family transcriptional regulator [Leptolyngbya sp. BC1307]